MTFEEILVQARELLQRKGRVSYRALKLQLTLDDDYVEGLKDELIDAEHVAVDEGGKVLVWVGSTESRGQNLESNLLPSPDPRHETLDLRPVTYTPQHLAERIRATEITDGE